MSGFDRYLPAPGRNDLLHAPAGQPEGKGQIVHASACRSRFTDMGIPVAAPAGFGDGQQYELPARRGMEGRPVLPEQFTRQSGAAGGAVGIMRQIQPRAAERIEQAREHGGGQAWQFHHCTVRTARTTKAPGCGHRVCSLQVSYGAVGQPSCAVQLPT